MGFPKTSRPLVLLCEGGYRLVTPRVAPRSPAPSLSVAIPAGRFFLPFRPLGCFFFPFSFGFVLFVFMLFLGGREGGTAGRRGRGGRERKGERREREGGEEDGDV